jgi:hypothetical protein
MSCHIAPRQQFESLGFEKKIIEKFGDTVKLLALLCKAS